MFGVAGAGVCDDVWLFGASCIVGWSCGGVLLG